MLQKYFAKGNVNFPLIFPIKADSYGSAANYASSVLNDKTVLKVEMQVFTSDGKIHLIICDEFCWNWAKEA